MAEGYTRTKAGNIGGQQVAAGREDLPELDKDRPQVLQGQAQAPHHGSKTSSSMVFLKALAPEIVLISRGHGNSFGHPHPQVMARYQALGVQVLDSAEQGAVKFRLGASAKAESMRDQRRFWRD